MQVKLEEAFSPGQTCSYEYDFGSTTELLVKVTCGVRGGYEGEGYPGTCRGIVCQSSLATYVENPLLASILTASLKIKGICVMRAQEHHGYSEGRLLPLANSPRAGVCGYTGQDPAYVW